MHPSLLPRWRGAAPVERAIMAGDAETGVSIMRLTAGLDSGPVCLQEREPIHADDDYGTLAARLEDLGSRLLVQALDERPPFTEQPEEGVTYAEKIGPRDRSLDFTQPPEAVERTVRALRPHIGARLPLPDGTFLGVWDVRPAGPTLSPAGGCVRRDGDRLLLDCNGGALELVEIQPPGGRRMPAAEWLRGRPDERLTGFWLDAALPDRELDDLIAARRRRVGGRPRVGAAPVGAVLARQPRRARGDAAAGGVRATRASAASPPTCSASSACRCARSRARARRRSSGWPPASRTRPCSPRSPTRSATSATSTAPTCCCGWPGTRTRRCARASCRRWRAASDERAVGGAGRR